MPRMNPRHRQAAGGLGDARYGRADRLYHCSSQRTEEPMTAEVDTRTQIMNAFADQLAATG